MDNTTFEKSFKRLEEILHQMNEGKASLDESIKLYVEADELILTCSKKLGEAEQKIEKLMKNRQGVSVMNEKNEPKLEPFENSDVPF